MTRHGSVHGGLQPVSGATLQLYAVGTTGDGSAATPLLSTTTTSGADGSFDITGKYSCPVGAPLVYIVATGGNPGLAPGTSNSALGMMSALGHCDSLTASTFIVINEVTTVAAVAALSPFMTSPSNVGSTADDASALANAFALASAFVNTSTGTSPGLNVPAGTVVPEAKINTLANIVTSCVNSAGGTANDGSACGTLFTLTTVSVQTPPTNILTALNNVASNPALNTAALFNLAPSAAPYSGATANDGSICGTLFALTTVSGQTAPTDIITALTNIANNPSLNTIPLFNLAPSSAPFQPTLTAAPTDFSIQLLSTGGTGSSGPITLSPASLTFYQTNVPQTVTMTNTGLTPVTIQSINISPNWSQTNNCGTVLQAQSICTINVQSTSSTLGTFSGTMTVVDDDTSDAQVVAIEYGQRNAGRHDRLWILAYRLLTGPNPPSLFIKEDCSIPKLNSNLLTGNFTGPNPGDFTADDSNWENCHPLSTARE